MEIITWNTSRKHQIKKSTIITKQKSLPAQAPQFKYLKDVILITLKKNDVKAKYRLCGNKQ